MRALGIAAVSRPCCTAAALRTVTCAGRAAVRGRPLSRSRTPSAGACGERRSNDPLFARHRPHRCAGMRGARSREPRHSASQAAHFNLGTPTLRSSEDAPEADGLLRQAIAAYEGASLSSASNSAPSGSRACSAAAGRDRESVGHQAAAGPQIMGEATWTYRVTRGIRKQRWALWREAATEPARESRPKS